MIHLKAKNMCYKMFDILRSRTILQAIFMMQCYSHRSNYIFMDSVIIMTLNEV